MKLCTAALALLCLALSTLVSVQPAHANCTTPCTKAQIITDINTNWPDNTAGAITPATLRSTVLDLVNSYLDVNGASTFSCPTHQFLVAIATLSSYTCGQPNVGDISGGAALTKVDDTNVTVTLGGTPTSALLAASSITMGWTGTLSVARGGTGDSGTAWSTFTPSPACGTATITTNSARQKTLGKTVFVEVDFTITAIGTCTNSLTFTLPFTPAASGGMSGRETATANALIGCANTGTATTMACATASAGGFNFLVNNRVVASGVMESQ